VSPVVFSSAVFDCLHPVARIAVARAARIIDLLFIICPSVFDFLFLLFRAAKSAHEIDDEADQQNQAKPAAADDGTAKVKSAAAEQEKQDNHE
jgi:hypothetical protein